MSAPSPGATDGHLGGFVSINSVVCLWVKKSHFFFVIILNNSKSGGDGKRHKLISEGCGRGRQQENTSENKFIFLAQRQRTGAWSRAQRLILSRLHQFSRHSSQVVIKIPLFTVILMASPLYADRPKHIISLLHFFFYCLQLTEFLPYLPRNVYF